MAITFYVIAGIEPALLFERPHDVLHASVAQARHETFERIETALSQGYWIAGYVAYDGRASIGIFDAPSEIALPDGRSKVEHTPLLPLVSREEYGAHVAALQTAIRDGDVYQVNYTIPFALRAIGDPLALYAWYARRSGAAYQAYVEDGGLAVLSWSPELFLAFEGTRLMTKPMKGTAPLERIEELRNAKNRAEHVMIVDLLRNDLRRVCAGVAVEAFESIERYPTFATMTSTIAGTIRAGVRLGEVFEAMFPCGSVTGAPKRAAISFIAEHEARPRNVYCGTVGFLSPRHRGWWNVAIRTAQIDIASGLGRYDAGGGIVADSRAESEWQELLLKARFLQDADFAVLETFASDAGDAATALHLARLDSTAQAFGIRYDPASLGRACQASSASDDTGMLVRVRVAFDGTIAIDADSLGRAEEPVPVCIADARVRRDDPFLRHKTSWRPAHDAAAREAARRGCFDALLRNERDEVTEGSRTNLFFELDGALWTPPLECGLLPGILRRRLVSQGTAGERAVTAAELRRAGAIYIGNSARGLLRAHLIE